MRAFLPCLILGSVALAGCGGGARSAAPAADVPSPAPSSAPTAAPSPAPAAEPASATVAAPAKVEPARPTRKQRAEAASATPAVPPPAPAPALPAMVDHTTTAEHLAAHALIVAQEEVAAGSANGAGVLDRQAQLIQAWTPLMQARQAELAAVRADREARSGRQVREAERLAASESRLRRMEADLEAKAEAENAKTAPILPQ